MINIYGLEKHIKRRHKELVEAARLEQLIQEAKGPKPGWQKLTGRVGDWLSGLGYGWLTAAARAGQAGQRLAVRWRLKKAEGR